MAWYITHHRKLPWRAKPGRKPDPYHVLVSEAMLQQTQVSTVVPYFLQFITTFPTLTSLAQANEQQVLHLWQGLGYYRRARHLHQAAQKIMAEFNGELPRDVKGLMTLPGVGRYTAGAIASIAFGKAEPVVDGNVSRVLARLFALEAAIDHPDTNEHLWQLAGLLVPRKQPGDFNQALMELGATICTPTSPGCLLCPVAELCQAHQHGLEQVLPRRWKRPVPKVVQHHMLAIRAGESYLMEQRSSSGLWAGMWQFPTVELDDDAQSWSEVQLLRHTKSLVGVTPAVVDKLAQFNHATTHRSIRFTLWLTTLPVHDEIVLAQIAELNTGQRCRWCTFEQIRELPQSNPQRKAVTLVRSMF